MERIREYRMKIPTQSYDDVSYQDPFVGSLWGECVRTILIGTSLLSAFFWALKIKADPAALYVCVSHAMMVAIALGPRWLRVMLLLICAVPLSEILITFSADQGAMLWWSPIWMFSPASTLFAFSLLFARECFMFLKLVQDRISVRFLVMTAGALSIGAYMIVLPTMEMFWDSQQELPTSFVVEDPTVFEILRVRSAKLAVFAVFIFVGGCLGSFVNVAATCIPKGQSFLIRSSVCPKCENRIRRIDNIPVLSYLWLGGKCRFCGVPIPTRYLAVELIGMAIFGILFLFQLVNGAENIPGFPPYSHTGVVWMILYAKWKVIGVYVLHCGLFVSLLTLMLMEQNQLRPPIWFTLILSVLFASMVISIPSMLTVDLNSQTPFELPSAIAGWQQRALSCLSGAIVAWLVSLTGNAMLLRKRQSASALRSAFLLIGVTLGWQAVSTIAVLWWTTGMVIKWLGGVRARPRWFTVTTLLFMVTLLHHPLWQRISSVLSF